MSAQKKNELLGAVADHLRYLKTVGIVEIPKTVGRPLSTFARTKDVGRKGTSTMSLAEIREEIGDCTRCKLCRGRTNIVFGVGNSQAQLMFVGEGPGADEDTKGEPFVGRAGQLLTKIIEAMGYQRSDVYIANVVKCRPPQNRAPEPEEMATCMPFLHQQIAAIHPQVIVCLGSIATKALLQTEAKISALRGHFHEMRLPAPTQHRMVSDTIRCPADADLTISASVQVMPTFHPAYLLRNPDQKRLVWEDMKQVVAALKR